MKRQSFAGLSSGGLNFAMNRRLAATSVEGEGLAIPYHWDRQNVVTLRLLTEPGLRRTLSVWPSSWRPKSVYTYRSPRPAVASRFSNSC
jgi:hypothetical protein